MTPEQDEWAYAIRQKRRQNAYRILSGIAFGVAMFVAFFGGGLAMGWMGLGDLGRGVGRAVWFVFICVIFFVVWAPLQIPLYLFVKPRPRDERRL